MESSEAMRLSLAPGLAAKAPAPRAVEPRSFGTPDYTPLLRPSAVARAESVPVPSSAYPAGPAPYAVRALNRLRQQRRLTSPSPAAKPSRNTPSLKRREGADHMTTARASFGGGGGGGGGSRSFSAREPILPAKRGSDFPYYFALADPHLQDFYARKFGLDPSAFRRRKTCTGRAEDTLYVVSVAIGDRKNAGTTANLFLRLNGRDLKVPKQRLTKKTGLVKTEEGLRYKFERGSENVFKFKGASIAQLQSAIIESDGLTVKEGCFIEEVKVRNVRTKEEWRFPCDCWLSLYEDDCQTSRELVPEADLEKVPHTTYAVEVKTGDGRGAGTDANVFLTLYGESGQTPRLQLYDSEFADPFERGQVDKFTLRTRCVGKPKKLRIEHDNTGAASGWLLDWVRITDTSSRKTWAFGCGQWLAKGEGDGRICRDLLPSRDKGELDSGELRTYTITTRTGTRRGAGTDANVFITLFGKDGDSGEIPLKGKGNLFESGDENVFSERLGSLGKLRSVRIRHDNSGVGPGWFLEEVVVEDGEGRFAFPCGRWLSKTEDDGKVCRDLAVDGGRSGQVPYTLTLRTGDKRYAGTNAKVWVELHGGKRSKAEGSGTVFLEEGRFERAGVDELKLHLPAGLSPLGSVTIGHDNSGTGPGWLLEDVKVFSPETGLEQVFPCNVWLSTDEGDGQIQRTLKEDKSARRKKEKQVAWDVVVRTTDKRGAGTDANVFLTLYGQAGRGAETELANESDKFERGQVDTFALETPEIGVPHKIRVRHDNKGAGAAWHLDSISLTHRESGNQWEFPCKRWLARDEEDGEIVREIPAQGPGVKRPGAVVSYEVAVLTGSKRGAGTDADVTLTLYGEKGDTGERELSKSAENRNKFERGQVDTFTLEAVELGRLTKLRIGHNGKGPGADAMRNEGWYLDKVTVTEVGSRKGGSVTFPCDRWLAKDEDDGAIVRELFPEGEGGASADLLNTTTYKVSVRTADKRGAGTDARVFLQLFGKDGRQTDRLPLAQSENHSDPFERGQTDVFSVEAEDVGRVGHAVVGHDGRGIGAGWLLQGVDLEVPSRGEVYHFQADRWLAEDEGDGKIELELYPDKTVEKKEAAIPYQVNVLTGDIRGGGTDANVFLQVYGSLGKTENFHLRNRTDNFERGADDAFKVEGADVGRVTKIRVATDGKGVGAGWFLDRIILRKPRTKEKRRRPGSSRAGRPAASRAGRPGSSKRRGSESSDDDRRPKRKPSRGGAARPKSAKSRFSDSDDEDSLRRRPGSGHWKRRNFESGSEDESGPKRRQGRVGSAARPKSRGAAKDWSSEEEEAPRKASRSLSVAGGPKKRPSTMEKLMAQAKVKPRKAAKERRGSSPSDSDESGPRRRPKSGDPRRRRRPQSSDSNDSVWSGRQKRTASQKRRRGSDSYSEDWSEDSAEERVRQLKRGASVSGGRRRPDDSAPSDQWDSDEGPQISRRRKSLVPDAAKKRMPKGTVSSDEESADERKELAAGRRASTAARTRFDKSRRSVSTRRQSRGDGGREWESEESGSEEGEEEVETYHFVCGRWFSKSEDDGALVRELLPTDPQGRPLRSNSLHLCQYRVSVYTGDVSGAGTDANVFLSLHGEKGDSGERQLKESSTNRNKFERGQCDVFAVEAGELGELRKLKVWHDNAGLGAAWFLERVEVEELGAGEGDGRSWLFPCEEWFSTSKGDGQICRELVPLNRKQVGRLKASDSRQSVKEELGLELSAAVTPYTVRVRTAEGRGSGTDANVFITLFGEDEDSGPVHLKTSATHRNKFEAGNTDEFVLHLAHLGDLRKILIGHDDSGAFADWQLDSVEVDCPAAGMTWHFVCKRWLGKGKDDGKVERELFVDSVKEYEPCVPYEFTVRTSDVRNGGTGAEVFVQLSSADGRRQTRQANLCPDKALRKAALRRANTAKFILQLEDVGEDIGKLRIGHDGSSWAPGWHLADVVVEKLDGEGRRLSFRFPCDEWLAKDEGDGAIVRDLRPDPRHRPASEGRRSVRSPKASRRPGSRGSPRRGSSSETSPRPSSRLRQLQKRRTSADTYSLRSEPSLRSSQDGRSVESWEAGDSRKCEKDDDLLRRSAAESRTAVAERRKKSRFVPNMPFCGLGR